MSEGKLVYEPSETTHWKTLFKNKMQLLGSQNLNEGEELVVVIETVSTQIIKDKNGGEETVPVVTFSNAPPMALNITNAKTIANLYGNRYEDWIGKAIQVYAVTVKAFGDVTMALRVRSKIPVDNVDLGPYIEALESCETLEDLQEVYLALPKNIRAGVVKNKDEAKRRLSDVN